MTSRKRLFRHPQGRYISPHETEIAGIKTAIVDSHNEVFGYWFNEFYGKKPVALLHVDAHSDDSHDSNWGKIKKLEKGDSAHEVARTLGAASFIDPAVQLGMIDLRYWLIPDCSRVQRHPSKPGDSWRNLNDLVKDPELRERRLLLDIDLDGFDLIDPYFKIEWDNSGENYPANPLGRQYERRVSSVMRLLSKLQKPSLITIARSQTPVTYIHPDNVDHVQEDVLRNLRKVYGKSETK